MENHKVVRPTYPREFSIGVLLIIYTLAFLLSKLVFDLSHQIHEVYLGMFLVATAIMITVLILWEEVLFPIKIKEVKGEMHFHNHRNKIQTQLLIYCAIPLLFGFVFWEYEVRIFRFSALAAICIVLPLIEKLFSGVKNYNDFLKISNEKIEYKDNEKGGAFKISDIQQITIITHATEGYHQLELLFKNNDKIIIDLHEMELEDFYESIYIYAKSHYGHMLKEVVVEN